MVSTVLLYYNGTFSIKVQSDDIFLHFVTNLRDHPVILQGEIMIALFNVGGS